MDLDEVECPEMQEKYFVSWLWSENKIRSDMFEQFNLLTPKLNPSAQSCLPRFFTEDLNF
jgi:hypothetical protein